MLKILKQKLEKKIYINYAENNVRKIVLQEKKFIKKKTMSKQY